MFYSYVLLHNNDIVLLYNNGIVSVKCVSVKISKERNQRR